MKISRVIVGTAVDYYCLQLRNFRKSVFASDGAPWKGTTVVGATTGCNLAEWKPEDAFNNIVGLLGTFCPRFLAICSSGSSNIAWLDGHSNKKGIVFPRVFQCTLACYSRGSHCAMTFLMTSRKDTKSMRITQGAINSYLLI